jgi:hypothetical protein
MSQIIKAEISFTTPQDTDEKDKNTDVYVIMRKSNSEVVAAIQDNFGGEFPDDGSTKGPFEIPKKDIRCTPDELLRGRIVVGIIPHGGRGHDTWVFHYEALVGFDDGTSLCSSAHTVVLYEDHKEVTYGFRKC